MSCYTLHNRRKALSCKTKEILKVLLKMTVNQTYGCVRMVQRREEGQPPLSGRLAVAVEWRNVII